MRQSMGTPPGTSVLIMGHVLAFGFEIVILCGTTFDKNHTLYGVRF